MTATTIDEQRVQQFAERVLGACVDSMLVLMIDLADRTGLLANLSKAAATSSELADRAGLTERYVRECLGALVTGGLVNYDSVTKQYELPPEHALCLTGSGSTNLAPLSRMTTLLAHYVDDVANVAREGGGVPYQRYRPEFTSVMDGISRGTFDAHLVNDIVPLANGFAEQLRHGVRVADIGCGTGHSTVVLAHTFPASSFVGYDTSEDALAVGRAEAAEEGLTNVEFENVDIARLPDDPAFHAIVGFDVIHDQVDPAGVLHRVHRALEPGGTFLITDIKASSRLESNVANPLAPFLYGVSTLHCMTVSLANDGAGLGTVWGEELARTMLADAGFTDVTIHDVPDDPMNQVYVAHAATT